MKRIWLAMALAATTLTGCGITYNSPKVQDHANGSPVEVVKLTADTVARANRSTYSPRALPAAFYAVGGGASAASQATAGLPTPPFVPEETPQRAQLRLPPAAPAGAYRIGVGDVVLLATKSPGSTVAELTGLLAAASQRQGYTVRDDGTIAIPDIGTVSIAGLTIGEAESRLFQELVRNQIDPSFSLEVAEFNSQRVTVGGAIRRPGLVPITLNRLTLREALSTAGGVSIQDDQFGVVRLYRDGRLYEIPMEDYRRSSSVQNTVLTGGDALFVDTTYNLERALAFYRAQIDVIAQRRAARSAALASLNAEFALRNQALADARSNFLSRLELGAEDRDYVYMTGEFSTQTRVPLPFNNTATLADVIYEVGGVRPVTGNAGQVYVLRASTGINQVVAFHLDMSNVSNIPLATKFHMRPNDVVFVEEQPITKWSRALDQAFPALISVAGSSATN